MMRLFWIIVLCSYALMAFSRSEIMAGYQEFEKQISKENDVRDYGKSHLNSVKEIPNFFKYAKRRGVTDLRKYYMKFLSIPDFGKDVWMTNYFNTIEYRYVLKHLHPVCYANGNTDKFTVGIKYGKGIVGFEYNFDVHCRYRRRTTKVEDLGFFEVFGTAGMAESKNVTYDVYSCNLSKRDILKIKSFERKIGTDVFGEALDKYPKDKYVAVGKTYNRATYQPSAVSSSHSTPSAASPRYKNSSAPSRSSSQNVVKEVYDGGYKSHSGKRIYRIKCTNGSSYSAYQENDGYWYNVGSNYGSSYRNLSLSEFAQKICH